MTIRATCHNCGRPIFEGSPMYTDLIFAYCSPKCKADYKAFEKSQVSGGGNSGGMVSNYRKPTRAERRASEAAQLEATFNAIHTRNEYSRMESKKRLERARDDLQRMRDNRKEELGKFVYGDNKELLLEKLDKEAENRRESCSVGSKYFLTRKYTETELLKLDHWHEEAKALIEEAWAEEQNRTLLLDRITSIDEGLTEKYVELSRQVMHECMEAEEKRNAKIKKVVGVVFIVAIIAIIIKCIVG